MFSLIGRMHHQCANLPGFCALASLDKISDDHPYQSQVECTLEWQELVTAVWMRDVLGQNMSGRGAGVAISTMIPVSEIARTAVVRYGRVRNSLINPSANDF
jgi:hypothetical protein